MIVVRWFGINSSGLQPAKLAAKSEIAHNDVRLSLRAKRGNPFNATSIKLKVTNWIAASILSSQ
jgi:hypothetical protein